MACKLNPDTCRGKHIASRLNDAERRSADWEARCPICQHSTFRVSVPRVRKYRHIWTCACKGCGCTAGAIRVALLKLGIMGWCLGVYDGPVERKVAPEIARNVDLVLRDIWATPHLKPADMRLALAEAQGHEVPTEYRPFIKFAMSIGISKTRAKEAAEDWCRPSDGRPHTRGAGSQTSRNTTPTALVKPPSSEPQEWSVSDQQLTRNGPSGITDNRRSEGNGAGNVRRSETDQPEDGTTRAMEVLHEAGMTGNEAA